MIFTILLLLLCQSERVKELPHSPTTNSRGYVSSRDGERYRLFFDPKEQYPYYEVYDHWSGYTGYRGFVVVKIFHSLPDAEEMATIIMNSLNKTQDEKDDKDRDDAVRRRNQKQ